MIGAHMRPNKPIILKFHIDIINMNREKVNVTYLSVEVLTKADHRLRP